MRDDIVYQNKGLGLHEEIERQGFRLRQIDGFWRTDNPVEVQQIIDTYDPDEQWRSQASVGTFYLRLAMLRAGLMPAVETALQGYGSRRSTAFPARRYDQTRRDVH